MPVALGILCCPGMDECSARMDALELPSRDTCTSLDCLFKTQSTSSIPGVVCVACAGAAVSAVQVLIFLTGDRPARTDPAVK